MDTTYWEDLHINCTYLLENWTNIYKKSLEKFLKGFDEENLFDLCEISNSLGFSGKINENAKKEYIKILLDSGNWSKELFLLKTFLAYKTEIVRRRYDILQKEKKLRKFRKGNAFLMLVILYQHDKKILKDILVRSLWIRNLSTRKIYLPSIPLKKKFIDDFDTKVNKLVSSLKSKGTRKLEYKYVGKISDSQSVTYNILRQTGDKLIRNVDKNKRNRLASDLLIKFDLNSNLLEIRCKDGNVIKKAVDSLEDIIRIHFIENFQTPITIDLEHFIGILETNPQDLPFEITGITFKESKIEGNPPLSIPSMKKAINIIPSIKDLIEREIISANIDNISEIILKYDGKQINIELKETREVYCFKLIKGTKLTDSQRGTISNGFRRLFGFELDELFLLDDNISWEIYLNYLFAKKKVSKHETNLLSALEFLKDKEIVDTKEKKVLQCHICRKNFSKGIKCPSCSSTEITNFDTTTEISLPRKKILKYILSQLDEGFEIINENMVRTWSKSYEFLHLQYDNLPVQIYINYTNLSPKLVSFFRRSGLPVIIVSIGSHNSKSISELANFTEIDIVDLLLKIINKKEFNKLLIDQTRESHAKLLARASESLKTLQQIGDSYKHSYFEDDCFNLLQNFFKDVEQWGKEKTAKEVPEGMCYLSFETKNGFNKRTFSWDCKYAYKDKYPIGINEKRQAESYIRYLMKSKEVLNFSGILSSYFFISNGMTKDQITKIGEYIFPKITSWKGNMILLHLDVLIHLAKLFDTKSHLTGFNHSNFKKKFNNLVLRKNAKKENRIIVPSIQDIEKLFS